MRQSWRVMLGVEETTSEPRIVRSSVLPGCVLIHAATLHVVLYIVERIEAGREARMEVPSNTADWSC